MKVNSIQYWNSHVKKAVHINQLYTSESCERNLTMSPSIRAERVVMKRKFKVYTKHYFGKLR